MLKNINDLYRFTIFFPTVGPVEVKPVNDTLEWTYEKEDEQIFYRKTLATELIFEDKPNENKQDFTHLYTHERSPDKCDNLRITIEKKCEDVWYLWHEGELHMIDGDWDPDRCEVSITPRPLDNWTCIERRMKEEINLFDRIPERKSLTTILARIERKTCRTDYPAYPGVLLPNTPNSSCLGSPQPFDWNIERHAFAYRQNGDAAYIITTWIREIYEFGNQFGPPDGNGWTDRGNGVYTREIPTRFVSKTIEEFALDDYLATEELDIYEPAFPTTGAIDNGLRLKSVIKVLFEDCDYSIISDFYGIAADGTAPDNHAYQKAAEECQRLYAYQITDIKDIDASNNATQFPMSIEKLLSNLKTIHNVYPGFDSDGNLRLEHITYWKGRYMLDLTKDEVKEYIAGHYKYKYDKLDLPKKESWAWMDTTPDRDFAGLPITYGSCFNNENPDEKVYPADYTVTDILNLRRNIDQHSDDGMVLIAATEGGLISRTACLISGSIKFNGSLSFANLLYNYHRWRRPQKMGVMNNQDEPFFDPMHTRVQVPISIPICCSDQISFDPKDFVKTQMGWGEVVSAKLTDPEGELELELKHT